MIREFRCCLCPNIATPEVTECPAGKPCEFVRMFVDKRGWRYRVMPGLGDNNFKARYNKPGKTGWKCMANLKWCSSFDEAQADLNALAINKGWKVVLP